MTRATPSAWDALREALRALYVEEIERLAEKLKPRILMGEFSGMNAEETEPKYMSLERDLTEHHPWLRSVASARAIIGISPWTLDSRAAWNSRRARSSA